VSLSALVVQVGTRLKREADEREYIEMYIYIYTYIEYIYIHYRICTLRFKSLGSPCIQFCVFHVNSHFY